MKSFTFKIGGMVEPSQLAYGSPAAKRLWKHRKSLTLRMGGVVLWSQFA